MAMLTGNELINCHCGSGRKRGWWKAHCAACEDSCTDNSHQFFAKELLRRTNTLLYSDKEVQFLESMRRWPGLPTEKQQHWLEAIIYRNTHAHDPGIREGGIRDRAGKSVPA